MKDKQTLLRCAVLFCMLALLVPFGINVVDATANSPKDATQNAAKGQSSRPDRITLGLSQVEKLELPKVTFLHDKHTVAMVKDGKGCESCHSTQSPEKGMSLKFLEASSTAPYAVAKDYYHTNCVSCHVKEAKAGKVSGPEASQCRSCHSDRKEVGNSWIEIGMDKSLHYRHISSAAIVSAEDRKLNCASCHHVYDAKSQKLVWGKGAEDSCRACHGEVAKKVESGKMQPSFASASHNTCVTCHYNVAQASNEAVKAGKKAIETGPYTCEGCHSAKAQGTFEVKADVPRLERGQPDAVLMVPVRSNPAIESKGSMRPVAFDHKRHEAVTKDCRSCHHVKIDSCSSCHSLDATDKGKGINLAQAMHSKKSSQSCVGCHNVQKAKPECASCHGFVKTAMKSNSCDSCHVTPVGVSDDKAQDGSLAKLSKDERIKLGLVTVAARKTPATATEGMMRLADVPEFVTIGAIAKEYEPAKLPHRQIITALAKAVGDNSLANSFHRSELALCQGCHHNSPPSKTPPACISCHGQPMASPDGRPGILAAYHQQCMGCHTRMEMAKPSKTDCVSCHKERAKS